jgi:2-polyprenyl-3-methyl-5-hydroxy-6-metoxy-1,4-benzoquinol methylase
MCPVCGCAHSQVLFRAASWESFARDQVYEIRRCNNCHLAFTSPTVGSEALDVFYTQGLYRETRNRLYTVVEVVSRIFQWSRLRKITREHQQGKLLDVGCGKGRFLAYAAAHGWTVYGVEPSENGRKVARSRLGDRVVRGLDELDLVERFDVVTLWHVLEHVSTPVQMLRQTRPYVKPGGFVYIAMPNFASLQARLGGEHWIHLDIPRHRIHYTPDTLKYTLALAGYATLWVDHFSIEFNPIGLLQTILNLLRCEPGLIYSFVKRNLSCCTDVSRIRFLYNAMMAVVGIPLLILPVFLFAYLESLVGRGGTILVCAAPVESKG